MDHTALFQSELLLRRISGLEIYWPERKRAERPDKSEPGLDGRAAPRSETAEGRKGVVDSFGDRPLVARPEVFFERGLHVGGEDAMAAKGGAYLDKLIGQVRECTHVFHRADYGLRRIQQIKGFYRRFYLRNACWLDFSSQIHPELSEAVANLHWSLDPLAKYPKPIVITVLNARDQFRGEDQRIDHILTIQPRMTYNNHWTFVGKGRVSMLTACFTLNERQFSAGEPLK